MKTVVFSVIIPIYNSELYIDECINSLIKQDFSNFEIILIDDGSTDSSPLIINKYKEKDDRIHVIKQSHKNAGVARNKGLNVAIGEYLLFIDADDFVSDVFFSELSVAISNKPDLVVFGALEYNHANKRTKQINESLVLSNCPTHSPFSPLEMSDKIFNTFQNWAWNKAFKRSFIIDKGIKFQDVNRSNDMLFVDLALTLSEKINVIPNSLIIHRIGHGTNMQANNSKEPFAFWDAYNITYMTLKTILKNDFSAFEKSFLNFALSTIKDYLYSMRDNLEVFNQVKDFIVENSEKDFKFLSHNADYYDQESYEWYINLLNGKNDEHTHTKLNKFSYHNPVFYIFRKTIGLYTSIKDNGFDYTIHRIMFHLYLEKDNDPVRTKQDTINKQFYDSNKNKQ